MNSFLTEKNDKKKTVTCMSQILVVRSSWSVSTALCTLATMVLFLSSSRLPMSLCPLARWAAGLQARWLQLYGQMGAELVSFLRELALRRNENFWSWLGKVIKGWGSGILVCVQGPVCSLYFSSIVAGALETWSEEEIKTLYFPINTLYPCPFQKTELIRSRVITVSCPKSPSIPST